MSGGAAADAAVQNRSSLRVLLSLLLMLGLVPFLWPGDTHWINDEPQFILKALATRHGDIATTGLPGTSGVVYGPMAVWLYSLLLFLTTDLISLVVLRALLVTAGTIVGILWMASLGRLRPACGAVALLSPYLWFYSRPLWDNTFLIPLSAVALCAYVSFSLRPTAGKLWITACCLSAMFLTHLMSLALIIPVLVHFVRFHQNWIRERSRLLLVQVAAVGLFVLPYLFGLVTSLIAASHRAAEIIAGTAPDAHPRLRVEGWLFPLFGGRFFSAWGLDYFFGANWARSGDPRFNPVLAVAVPLSYLGFVLVWAGMAIAAARVWRWIREGRPEIHDADLHLSLLSLGVFSVMVVMNGVMQTFGHPHYYNASWICCFYFAWTALSVTPQSRRVAVLWTVVRGFYAASLALVIGYLVVTIHENGGNRDIHYGAVLQNQIAVSRKLSLYDPASPVELQVENYILFPHALDAIRRIYYLEEGTPGGPLRRLRVRHLHPEGDDGWVIVEELPLDDTP